MSEQKTGTKRKRRGVPGASTFLEDFNPATSAREKRKRVKKQESNAGLVYDRNGVHIRSNLNACDCFDLQCPGCFYPCRKCGSTRCGADCRCARKNKYVLLEYHGYDYYRENPLED